MYHLIVKKDNLANKKNAEKFKRALEVFDGAGINYTIHETSLKDEAKNITREVTSGKGNSVITVGGDGTLHDVLNGFCDFENNTLGLIPFGTGNDFAESAHIPFDAEKAAQIIVEGYSKKIDFIQLENGLRSINAVGMGIDVDVLKRAYSGKSVKRSKYLKALIVSLIKFKSYDFTVKYNGKEENHFGLIAALGNGRQIGGGIKMFPEADISDGKLNLFIADYISKPAIIGAFSKLMRGKVNKVRQVTALACDSVEFIPHGENFTIEADGELYENVPLKAHIERAKLNFYLKNENNKDGK